MISFQKVTKTYDRRANPALSDVSLDVERGEFVFLVGPSGSGKSTFIRLILREEIATGGRILVAGQDISRIPMWKVPHLRRNVGTVFQDFRLLPNKTVFDNVAFALQVIGKSRAVIKDKVPEVLSTVGLRGKERRLPHELSGGEQQRVAIARAVVNRPGILLADEPTGNLDPETSLEIMDLLARINKNGTTVMMATHDDEIVNAMKKRVVELSGGEIVRDQASGRYREAARMRLQFVLSEIGSGLRRNFSMVLSVILVTFVSLTFVGAGLLLQMQIGSMKDYWYDRVEVAVFLCPPDSEAPTCSSGEVTQDQIDDIEAELESDELSAYVDEVFFEDKATAHRLYEEQFADTPLAGAVPEDQMSQSFRIKLVDPEQYEIIDEYFSATPGIEEVVDQNRLLDQLFSLMNIATAIAIGIAVVMLICAVLLIGTTIRLSAQSRRRETGIMRLVGASNTLIQLPFVLEGVVAAAIGALLASGVLAAIVHFFVAGWLQPRVPTFTMIGLGDVALVGAGLVLLGILMAVIASVLTLRRYLRV